MALSEGGSAAAALVSLSLRCKHQNTTPSDTSARVQGTPRTLSQHQRWNIFHKGVKAALDPPGTAGDTEGWTGPRVLPGL